MQEITYKQAAELLECEYITIRQAVSSGRLTKCVNKTTLLREQVALFKGKRGITMHVLTIEEKNLWDSYKEIAENPNLLSKINFVSMTDSEVLEQIIENKIKEKSKEGNKEEVLFIMLKSNKEAIEDILNKIGLNPTLPLVHQI